MVLFLSLWKATPSSSGLFLIPFASQYFLTLCHAFDPLQEFSYVRPRFRPPCKESFFSFLLLQSPLFCIKRPNVTYFPLGFFLPPNYHYSRKLNVFKVCTPLSPRHRLRPVPLWLHSGNYFRLPPKPLVNTCMLCLTSQEHPLLPSYSYLNESPFL